MSDDLMDHPLSLLDPEGTWTPDQRLPLSLDGDALVGLYRDMVLARRLDTEAVALQRQGELGLWASLLGQEAAQVGAARALRPQDMAFPTYREHAMTLCRGIDPVQLLSLFRGTSLGGWDPAQHNVALYTIVIGAQTLHAAGYAMGVVRDGDVGTGDDARDTAVIAFLGDGALSEGETNEAFVWAATQALPVVFFCQNNQWAISAPYSTQSRVPAAQRAAGFGFPGVRVDGNDVLACLSATRQALDRARAGGGPTLIEAVTYRLGPHTTSDDAGRYRDGADTQLWRQRDPIDRLRRHLAGNGLFPDGLEDQLTAEADALGARLRDGCRALPDPGPASSFTTTFAEITPALRQQRDDFTAFVGSFGDPVSQEVWPS
jgi:2-oxoisovalerate dehydrogenase E1 component alpha subunit